MNKILKDEFYSVTSGTGESQLPSSELVKVFKRAAVKQGFLLNPFGVYDGANVGEIGVYENIPFATMQKVLNEVAKATKLAIFLSASTDLLGKPITSYPVKEAAAVVRKEAILTASP